MYVSSQIFNGLPRALNHLDKVNFESLRLHHFSSWVKSSHNILLYYHNNLITHKVAWCDYKIYICVFKFNFQYRNSGNPLAHYDGTAMEILDQCEGIFFLKRLFYSSPCQMMKLCRGSPKIYWLGQIIMIDNHLIGFHCFYW